GAELDEPREHARRSAGVDRREDEVPRQTRLERDARGLGVADLADEQDLRVLTEQRAQRAREVETSARVDLRLHDARHVALDRVLDADDAAPRLLRRDR